MIKLWKILRSLWPKRSVSLERAIARIVGGDVRGLVAEGDRREIVSKIAVKLGVIEEDLARAVARELRLLYVATVAPVDLTEVGVSIGELRRCGCIPVVEDDRCVAMVCVDPSILRDDGSESELPRPLLALPRHISQWSLIAAALDESERRYLARRSTDGTNQLQVRLAEAILGDIVTQMRLHNATEVRLEAQRYSFLSHHQLKGEGSIERGAWNTLREILTSQSTIDLPPSPTAAPEAGSLRERCIVTRTEEGFALRVVELRAIPVHAVRSASERSPMARPTALIVEDNPTFAAVFERYLKRHGVSVGIAYSVDEAQQRIDNHPPTLVILDLHLPERSGLSLLQWIRASPALRRIPVIVLTSESSIEAHVELLRSGAETVVLKSEDPRVLSAHIERLLVCESKPRVQVVA